jgi:hypothetical protein
VQFRAENIPQQPGHVLVDFLARGGLLAVAGRIRGLDSSLFGQRLSELDQVVERQFLLVVGDVPVDQGDQGQVGSMLPEPGVSRGERSVDAVKRLGDGFIHFRILAVGNVGSVMPRACGSCAKRSCTH